MMGCFRNEEQATTGSRSLFSPKGIAVNKEPIYSFITLQYFVFGRKVFG